MSGRQIRRGAPKALHPKTRFVAEGDRLESVFLWRSERRRGVSGGAARAASSRGGEQRRGARRRAAGQRRRPPESCKVPRSGGRHALRPGRHEHDTPGRPQSL
eukprot:scaffold581_cov263-Pinguiococcus_pyrenoidosus.AAC.5